MRRDPAAWLIVLLFALPLAICLGVAVWADGDYERRLQAVRDDPLRSIELAIESGFWRELGYRQTGADLLPAPDGRRWELYFGGEFEPRVHLGYRRWALGDVFPGGTDASKFADLDARLQLELGAPGVLSARAALFVRLCRQPDLELLRGCDLPAESKLFLLDRDPTEFEGRAHVRHMLALAAEYRDLENRELPGLHETRSAYVLQTKRPDRFGPRSRSRPSPVVLIPKGAPLRPVTYVVDPFWSVVYGMSAADGALHEEWREGGVRGYWSIVPTHGLSWLDVPTYRRVFVAAAGGSLAYLAVPIALAITLRRRKRLDRARRRFLTEVAHDLRTPLTAIRLHAEMLATHRGDPAKRERYIDVMDRESTRASELLGSLLDFSRLEDGRRRFDLVPVPLTDVVEACADEFRQLHPERAEDLRADGSFGSVQADRTALARCLRNLLDNAAKYTRPGTPIRIGWSDDSLVVRDEGPGLSDPARMFRAYERGPDTASAPGSGVGLALVKELIEGMGGHITYAGAPGAEFRIALPRGGDA
ncbi:MAG: HAMP domain-containing sensor histidine kinase [Planctomycetota bacterium]